MGVRAGPPAGEQNFAGAGGEAPAAPPGSDRQERNNAHDPLGLGKQALRFICRRRTPHGGPGVKLISVEETIAAAAPDDYVGAVSLAAVVGRAAPDRSNEISAYPLAFA